ncbi:hypothetical protein MMC22_010671 [Lobaria immixta]|nr:hypothetical protein [Lobaria immixta]
MKSLSETMDNRVPPTVQFLPTTVPAFLKHNPPELEPAVSNLAWANATGSFRAEKLAKAASPRVKSHTARFKGFISACSQKSKDHALAAFEIASAHEWEDVEAEADNAIKVYNTKGKIWQKNPARVTGRAMGKIAPAIQAWLELLPDGEYTSIVCGALKLVFGVERSSVSFAAAARMQEIRNKILNTMASMSDTVDASKDYLEIYRDDQKLFERAEDLYIAVLNAVEGMILWIDESAYKDQITTELRAKTKAFCDRAKECLHHRVNEIGDGIKTLKDMAAAFGELLISNLQRAEWAAKYQTELALLSLYEVQRPSVIVVQTAIVSAEDLRNLMKVGHKTVDDDLQVALDYGRSMRSPRQHRATWLMQQPAFQQWFQASGSQVLIVDGMEREMDTTSPLTYFCAMLHQNLSNLQIAVPLIFFCGLHAKPGDYLEGARGVMRTLTHQLLFQRWDFDCSCLDYAFLAQVQTYDISHLCRLFRILLTSAPPATIFCMVEGISEYETSSRIGDVEVMMGYLRDFVNETNVENSGIDFKVLVTSATASRSARTWFPNGSYILMPHETGLDGQIDFNVASESGFLASSGYVNELGQHGGEFR